MKLLDWMVDGKLVGVMKNKAKLSPTKWNWCLGFTWQKYTRSTLYKYNKNTLHSRFLSISIQISKVSKISKILSLQYSRKSPPVRVMEAGEGQIDDG